MTGGGKVMWKDMWEKLDDDMLSSQLFFLFVFDIHNSEWQKESTFLCIYSGFKKQFVHKKSFMHNWY